jgi:predicted Ser/Thr protein kinase
MMPADQTTMVARLRRARELFEAAVGKDASLIQTLLDRECGADANLRAEVESLLRADEESQPVLDHPLVVPASALETLPIAPGEQVGRYRVVREIGAGGMGSVYLAELCAETPSPRFALKLVRRPWPEFTRQLEQEARILSCLEHPNIARLLDVGATAGGIPFLVMEYVGGEALHRYCAQHTPTLKQRLELFRQVCAAVRYLHQNLVIHRDLKPANILVLPGGHVKVVDFGIAKLVEATSVSLPAPGPMTLEYASPEQLRGEPLSVLSDVYTLGAVLSELLREEKFDRESRDVFGLPLDLGAVILKATEQERKLRYDSVEELDEDLRRFSRGLPVIAYGGSAWYQARKFAARHRWALAAGLALAAAMGAGLGLTLRETRIAEKERTIAEAEARKAAQQRFVAEQREAEAVRERARADRRLQELQQIAGGAVRAYQASLQPESRAVQPLLAESARDSLLVLGREGVLASVAVPELSTGPRPRNFVAQVRSGGEHTAPTGWYLAGSRPENYEAGVDERALNNGRVSAYLRGKSGAAGFGTLMQDFSATMYRSQRVRFRGFVKSAGVTGWAGLWMRVDGAPGTPPVSFDNMQGRPIRGTIEWREYDLVLDVPEPATGIFLGILLAGPGEVWLTSIDFETVSQAVPVSGNARQTRNGLVNPNFDR